MGENGRGKSFYIVVLISRSLRSLPQDLLGALDLNEVVEKEFPKASLNAMEVVSPGCSSAGCSSDQENAIVEISRAIVREAIEEAMLRVDGGKVNSFNPNWSGKQELKPNASGISPNISVTTAEEAWTVPQLTVKGESDLEDYVAEDKDSSGEESFECLPSINKKMYHSSEDELQSLARRIVLKSIQAACNEISARHQLSGSIECLISSTKRMKIESPPPPFVPSLPAVTTKNTKGSSNTDLDTPTKSLSPVPERALTPESLRREKQWKKRGRSESHEVSCLLDYDIEHSKYRTTSVRELDKGVGDHGETIREEFDTDEDDNLGTIVTNLTKLSLRHHNRSMNIHADGYSSDCNRSEPPSNADKHVRFTVYSPLLRDHHVASWHKNLLPSSLSPRHSLASMETQSSDIRIAFYENSMPEIDFFFMVHTCPPPGLCQKFTCSNYNEINLLFHCWLFKDAPCDPSVTVSAQLEMGVFKPKNVKPVHLDLVDAGVPFNYMEER